MTELALNSEHHFEWLNRRVNVSRETFDKLVGMLGGIVLAMRVRRDPVAAVLGIMAVYGVLACPWIMRMAEIRYLIPVFPLLIATSTWLALTTIERVRGRKDRASIDGPAQPVHRSSV